MKNFLKTISKKRAIVFLLLLLSLAYLFLNRLPLMIEAKSEELHHFVIEDKGAEGYSDRYSVGERFYIFARNESDNVCYKIRVGIFQYKKWEVGDKVSLYITPDELYYRMNHPIYNDWNLLGGFMGILILSFILLFIFMSMGEKDGEKEF